MKTLVTGATGFIGRYVVQELLNQGCTVVATSSDEQKAQRQEWFDRVTYVPLDLALFEPAANYYSFFGSPDNMIHLAWEGLPNYKANFHVTRNLPRHFEFLKNLITNGLSDLTVTGTCLEYGMQEGQLQEDMATQPTVSYAAAKDGLHRLLQELQASFPFSFRWIRLFYMYGKGQNENSLLSQLEKALAANESSFNMSGGEQVRDYMAVEEVASNIVKIALQDKVTGVINCCSAQPVTVKQLVENYLKNKNQQISLNLGYYPYSDYEPMAFWGDNRKLKSIQ